MRLEPDTEAWDMVANLLKKTARGKVDWETRSHSYDGPLATDLGEKSITLYKNKIEVWDIGEKHSWESETGMITDLYKKARSEAWDGKDGEEVAQEINSTLKSL